MRIPYGINNVQETEPVYTLMNQSKCLCLLFESQLNLDAINTVLFHYYPSGGRSALCYQRLEEAL